MGKLILYYSFLGAALLIFSRSMDTVLYYLAGYLVLFSYILTIALIIVNAKKKEINLRFFNYCIMIVSTIAGMTLFYTFIGYIFRLKI